MKQLVWFKRDLRTVDHAALWHACQAGPVLAIYVVEPDWWAQPDMSARHWRQVRHALTELQADLHPLGIELVLKHGEILSVLAELYRELGTFALHAHEETGTNWTYQRDLAVHGWCREHSISFHEYPQFGVVRRLARRDGWSARWHDFMAREMFPKPRTVQALSWSGRQPSIDAVAPDLADDWLERGQLGGRKAGRHALHSFLNERGKGYQRNISSPLRAEHGGSRLSPLIAWGGLSLREIVQATYHRQREVKEQQLRGWGRSLSSFGQRLRWHCHFIQKLESQPRLEFENMARFYDGMREDDFNDALLQAWSQGETGFPFVDACMRSLRATGWLNFRMRAMVTAFSAYHLWLHWRQPSLHLARMFSDYEPGIHYCQVQMQSGVTGINTVRIYNPVKQSQDQDPEGEFIARWVPELASLPADQRHQPWTLSRGQQQHFGVLLGSDYPLPVVDHLQAARNARDAVWARRKTPEARAESREVQQQLGSRRKVRSGPRRSKSSSLQRDLFEA
jgi:deoxyribodipyrimidine photo-lyase